METLRIPVFKPGRYLVPDPQTGQKKWVEYTPAHVQAVIKNGNAQLSAGLHCPTTWMHDLSASPEPHNRDKWIAKEWFTQPVQWEYDDRTGEAVAIAQVEDAADAKRAKKLKYVSPALVVDYVDQVGRKWPGLSVRHIASTPQPVQLGLTPVSDFTAYRQTLLSAGGSDLAGAVWLSYGTGVKGMNEEEVVAEGTVPGGEEVVAEGVGAGDGMDDLNRIVGLFAKFGVDVPEGDFATMAELADACEAAVNKASAGKGTDDMGAMGMNKPDHAPTAGPPVLMSMPSIPQHAAFIVRDAESQEKGLKDRIAELAKTGRISVAKRQALEAELSQVNLSLDPHRFYDASFQFHAPALAVKVAAYEELEPGTLGKQAIAGRATQGAMLSIKSPTAAVVPPGATPAKATDAETGGDMLDYVAKSRGVDPAELRAKMAKKVM
jgi:hypothetical protein